MSDRVEAAADEMLEINDRVALPAVQRIIATWNAVDLSAANGARLRAAADAIGESTRRFIADSDGAALAPLDPLWDPTVEDKTAEAPVRVTEIPDIPVVLPPPTRNDTFVVPADTARRDDTGSRPAAVIEPGAELLALDVAVAPAANIAAPPPAPAVAAAPPPVPAAVRFETLTRPSWRQPPSHAFVKVPCGRCHNSQERWWRSDPHSATARPFRANEPRNAEIAQAYGVAAGDMGRGDRICMSCHGTPVSSPSRKVRAGVGCQRCHGAGADYLEPHETIGYAASLALGLTDLRDPAVQAETCAGCHYITDPGLIHAGHSVGNGFEMRSRIDEIVHWGSAFGRDTVPVDREALAAAYGRVVADRGPAPRTRAEAPAAVAPGVAAATPPPATVNEPPAPTLRPVPELSARREPAAGLAAPGRPALPLRVAVPAGRPPRSAAAARPSTSRQRSRGTPTLVADPGLEAFRPDPEASVEATLDALRQRIERLYDALAT